MSVWIWRHEARPTDPFTGNHSFTNPCFPTIKCQVSLFQYPVFTFYIPPLNLMTSYSSLSSPFYEHWTLFLAALSLNKITQRDAIINQGFVCSSPLRNKNPLVSGSVQIIVCNPTLWHASHEASVWHKNVSSTSDQCKVYFPIFWRRWCGVTRPAPCSREN